jgi:hypothetical protein
MTTDLWIPRGGARGLALHDHEVRYLQETGRVLLLRPLVRTRAQASWLTTADILAAHSARIIPDDDDTSASWVRLETSNQQWPVDIPVPLKVGEWRWVQEAWCDALTPYHETGDADAHGGPRDPCCGYRADRRYTCGKPIPDIPRAWHAARRMRRAHSRMAVRVGISAIRRADAWPAIFCVTSGAFTATRERTDPTQYDEARLRGILAGVWAQCQRAHPWHTNPWIIATLLARVPAMPGA